MLQYITQNDNERFSIEEQCQMFIEGGGAWIQLKSEGLSDDRIRILANELIPLCKESSTILTIEDRPELAKELGVHGVYLSAGAEKSAAAVREEFGAEAIIGVEVGSSQAILSLKGRDIDYVTLRPGVSQEEASRIIKEANEAGNEMPIVLIGSFSIDDAEWIMSTGASGIATGHSIISSSDPVKFTEDFIAKLNSCRQQ
ncbi:MAG: thiamine phosphate synthase [Muribaculaceae bacterium]|nr:thiamine phosphate synthase [Muribaculaceae bacterium]